ncbi:MAG: hypothetical protein AAF899_18030 [Pseudomonadota bacterium]
MGPHPAFEHYRIPDDHQIGPYRLTRLTGADVEEDFRAVTASEYHLVGLFDDGWPRGLSFEENAVDLAWHDKEFRDHRSFAWVIRAGDGMGAGHSDRYLGCAYVYPSWTPGHATALFWFRSGATDHADPFDKYWHRWLEGPDWPHFEWSWRRKP